MFACRLCSNLGSKIVQTPKSLASMLKNIVSYPPLTHAFLKWPFLTDFKKYTHTPPYGMKFSYSGRKMEKTLKIHEFAPRWHILNVPERYTAPGNRVGRVQLAKGKEDSPAHNNFFDISQICLRLVDFVSNHHFFELSQNLFATGRF